MKRPLTEAANQLPDSEEKKQILKLIELFSDELTDTNPYLCRMSIQTYQQFLRFCDISDKYKFLTNFENMVQVLEAESRQIVGLESQIIGLKNEIKFNNDEIEELKDSVYHIIPFTHFLVTRKIKKLTLRQVSEITKLSTSTISRFENGKDISLCR